MFEHVKELQDELETLESKKHLTFDQFRHANLMRLPTFRNKNGQLVHSKPDGSDWSIDVWTLCILGELGELATWRKELERKTITQEEYEREAAKELADIVTYCDLLAIQFGIDLGETIRAKFNEVSDRVGSEVKL